MKGAKGATNHAYFTAFLVLKYIIYFPACKLLYFLENPFPNDDGDDDDDDDDLTITMMI